MKNYLHIKEEKLVQKERQGDRKKARFIVAKLGRVVTGFS